MICSAAVCAPPPAREVYTGRMPSARSAGGAMRVCEQARRRCRRRRAGARAWRYVRHAGERDADARWAREKLKKLKYMEKKRRRAARQEKLDARLRAALARCAAMARAAIFMPCCFFFRARFFFFAYFYAWYVVCLKDARARERARERARARARDAPLCARGRRRARARARRASARLKA